MSKFKVYLKETDGKGTNIATCNTFEEAVDQCVREVERTHGSERNIARDSLMKRMYYCMGYSSREVYIEEV